MIFSYSAEVAEALAIQEGCLLARELGLRQVIVESDAQNIVRAIQIKYTPRGTNKVAHMFAQHAMEIVDRSSWRNIGPNFILNQLQEDVPARSAS